MNLRELLYACHCKKHVNKTIDNFFRGEMWGISNIFTIFAADFNQKWCMSTFIGNIEGRLDEKGRIFVPAVYRKILAEDESKRIVMRRDTDNECLMFYPESVWNEKVEQLRQTLDEWDPEDQLILMQFMADAEYLEMDGQGRILLQKKNLETIGAQQDVLFVGMLNRFALWAPEKFAEKRLSQTELAARLRAKMKKKEDK